ncbi:MAG: aminodeoxychorismate/anthranilate synthase component II [Trueperaceae bacterium]|nr:aminodeoxychorismate/anthranilate synthase component II [Trueperaceae bacterium]
MKNILVIDNYDSFTYNLVQYLGELGVTPTVWRNDQFSLGDVAELAPDGILVSPGPCTPYEAGHSVAVIERYGATTPTFGVCLGHQSIGAAYDAKVVRATKLMHGKTSQISHDGSGVFADLPPNLVATRYHSLVVKDIPDTLIANAWVDEAGERVIMGLKHRDHPVWGVQFHPESILTDTGKTMLKNFLDIC